jgi:hypothetical protein
MEVMSKNRIGCLGCLVLTGRTNSAELCYHISNLSKTPDERARETAAAETATPRHTARQVALNETKIVKFSWHKGGFNSIMLADFTIRNNSDRDVKDLEIRCEHAGPSGTVIDHNEQTIYEIVKAHSTRTLREVNMGFIASQAAGSKCEILSLSLVNEP